MVKLKLKRVFGISAASCINHVMAATGIGSCDDGKEEVLVDWLGDKMVCIQTGR